MKRRTRGKRSAAKQPSGTKGWSSLTWDDLDHWTGSRSVSRGRSYQRQGRVRDLAISEDGRLLATVQGGERYVVSVWRKPKKKGDSRLQSRCTCPVGYDGCKHAVATVAVYLQALANNETVPAADPDDPRWSKLDGSEAELKPEDLNDDWEADDPADEELETSIRPSSKARKRGKARSPGRTRRQWDETIRQHICGKNQRELAELVCSLVERFPELREEFKERIALGEGDVDKLVAQARRELRDRTSEIGWQNHWQGEGFTPDYSRLKHRLERLLELGHADAVVELGREFISRAMEQIDQSHDEGETSVAVAECLPVVFDAVVKSSLPAPQKLLFTIDACLQDGYGVIDDSVGKVLDASWRREDWSAVADEVDRRLKKKPRRAGDDAWHENYRRDHISDWLLTALENAGRDAELLAVYEAEAQTTNSYDRLVKYLIAQRKYTDAERWAKEGIEKTCEKWPGIASSLAGQLCNLARRRKRWDVVASHVAVEFLERPSSGTFKELLTHAAKAKCQKKVRAAALQFLETGVSPVGWVESARKKKGAKSGCKLRIDPDWPLPVPDYLVPLLSQGRAVPRTPRPYYDVLLDMAIAARKPDDVLHWYDKMSASEKHDYGGWGGYGRHGDSTANRVAAAIAKSHPEQALEIYRRGLDAVLPQANITSYESAAAYLKRMRPIMKSLGNSDEWDRLVADIRQEYGNRPRFMDVLDKLQGRTILETQKSRRRRS